MTFLKIIIGLAELGIVVFIHELGHFLAARFSGIDVEAFSVGWGKPLLKKKIGNVEYRLGMLPIGGYCKMKGENGYGEAWENSKNGKAPDASSFYGAHPAKRVLTAFAGPFFNFLFAVVVLSIIWGAGVDVKTLENRIVVLADIDGKSYPSDRAGLVSGDRIIEIAGTPIGNYGELRENIGLNPGKALAVKVDRDGAILDLTVTPDLEKSGEGKIGVYYWTTPVVSAVAPESPAEKAGLKAGDRILSMNGSPLPYTVAVLRIFRDAQPERFSVEYERGGELFSAELSGVSYVSGAPETGIEYPFIAYRTPSLSPPAALAAGIKESVKTFAVSVKSLALLFRGVDLTQAVSGPARITYMVGEVAAQGFGENLRTGLSSAGSFLALISIALCFMNLLPLPILDGGLIVLSVVEGIKGGPLNPKFVSIFQTAGVVIIFGLMVFSLFNDILFFASR
ncbi:MAG: site-2 protease family protein [Treponema sp.]|jgi:regulator of sigma E protease|nr:site-2 protease family protein [Treponema sp.]